MAAQLYEDYWHLTLAYSKIDGPNFNGCLTLIVAFIDSHQGEIAKNPREAYGQLQSTLQQTFPIADPSTRKSINQFIKLGFINTGLTGYHPLTKGFLKETNKTLKKTLFSKIVYSNSSFDRAFDIPSSDKQINFFINTLTALGGKLSKQDAMALMRVKVGKADYFNAEQLEAAKRDADASGFADRKYNQVNYFWTLLKNLDDLVVAKDEVLLQSDPRAQPIEEETQVAKLKGRDSYLQRLYKNQLVEESRKLYGATVCMVEKLDYPVLIASHIKPYSQSNTYEAFDGNNGLLLCRSIDQLFDSGYISFADDGTMLVSRSRNLSPELTDHLRAYSLDATLLNPARKAYLQYHRNSVFSA